MLTISAFLFIQMFRLNEDFFLPGRSINVIYWLKRWRFPKNWSFPSRNILEERLQMIMDFTVLCLLQEQNINWKTYSNLAFVCKFWWAKEIFFIKAKFSWIYKLIKERLNWYKPSRLSLSCLQELLWSPSLPNWPASICVFL